MVLNFGNGMLFQDGGIFEDSPEDGQINEYSGARIIPSEKPSDTVTLTPLESALNVLQLQADAGITPGEYLELKMDISTDADGFLDTIDTGNTTAEFVTDTYFNFISYQEVHGGADTANTITVAATAILPGIIGEVYFSQSTTSATIYKVDIIQDSVTLATKSQSNSGSTKHFFVFSFDDYSNLIDTGSFQVVITRTSGSTNMYHSTNRTATNDAWSFSNQDFPHVTTGSGGPTSGIFFKAVTDTILQTNTQSIGAGFGNFQVVAFRQATTGTGSITADVSFNGGTNYQTVDVNTNNAIVISGTSMIVKLNLNAGASVGTTECKGWGVQLWQ